MPDWDEINRKKRKEINLGMAKNGAVQILKDNRLGHWSDLYKEAVRLLFLFNEELDKEILEGRLAEDIIEEKLQVLR